MLRPAHFAKGDFTQDFLKPFTERFAAGIHAVNPEAHIFIEAEPFMPPPSYDSADKLVYAPHFYDGITLFTRRFHPQLNFDFTSMRPLIGEATIRRYLSRQFGNFRAYADNAMGAVPIVIGEFGIPFDMNNAAAYHDRRFHAANDRARLQPARAGRQLAELHALELHAGQQQRSTATSGITKICQSSAATNRATPMTSTRADAPWTRSSAPYARKIAGEPLSMRFTSRQRQVHVQLPS